MSSTSGRGHRPVAAVLFDLGGVIADSPFDAFERYEREHDLPVGFIRSVNAANHLENAWARLERSDIGFEEFCDGFEAEARLAGGRIDARALFASFSGRLRPEMVEAVRRCSMHFKTGLLTNNFVVPAAESGTSVFDELYELFDTVVASSVIGVRKPDERFYLMACAELGVSSREAVFLDDLGVNLKAARALGMITIKVTDTASALSELEQVLGIALR